MFFIGGITQGTKELVYNAAAMICGRCGRYGRYQVFMTYMCLSFFFIPIFKWGRKYYVKTSCCGTGRGSRKADRRRRGCADPGGRPYPCFRGA